jgi:hypothetical protein
MAPRDFIVKIVNVYQDARVSHYVDEKIRRGRSHSISSIAEDLLASYLIYADKEIDLIYIDQPVHVHDTVKSFIPDIVIVRNDIITAFLDLKMDLGYKREGLIDLCEKDSNLLKLVRNKSCTLNDGQTKIKRTFTISKSAIYDIVVISNKNIAKDKFEQQINGSKLYEKDVAVHVLTEKEHPNTYGLTPEELLERIQINEPAFNKMLSRIK